jgi:ABC-type branched-subunit amino acid transport system substrate-binding protein
LAYDLSDRRVPPGSSEDKARPFGLHRRFASFTRLVAVASALSLAACSSVPTTGQGSTDDMVSAAPVDPVQSQPLTPPTGTLAAPVSSTQIGSGPVKVALILPLTQNTGPSLVGTSLRNAADLAVSEAGNSDITLLVKDDQGTPDGARAAAQSAITDGADLIIGPLFSPDVRAASQVAVAANKPMIAFSTDATVAQPGVYLLSFLVETYVDRIVDYAVAKGKKSFAALIPDNDYGRIAAAEFQEETARRGVRVMEIDHYQPQTIGAAVQKVAALGNQIDALFIADQAGAMPAVAQALSANGLNSHKVQILGTGLWNDIRVLSLPALQGAWFAAPDNTGFDAFAVRYRAKYGSDPTRIATLSYDAVSLAVALAHRPGPDRFSAAVLTNHAGFNGADGIFRFRPNGLNQRGLAIMEIQDGKAIQLQPAPHTLSASAT